MTPATSSPRRRLSFFLLFLFLPSFVVTQTTRCTVGTDGTRVCAEEEETVSDDDFVELTEEDYKDLHGDYEDLHDDIVPLFYDEDEVEASMHEKWCHNESYNCESLANSGDCATRSDAVQISCARSCMVCPDQQAPDQKQDDNRWRDRALSAGKLRDFEERPDAPVAVPADADACADGHELCAFWAGEGECDVNPNYMRTNCRKSCRTCKPAKEEGPATKRSQEVYDVAVEYGVGYWLYVQGQPQDCRGDQEERIRRNVRDTMAYLRNIGTTESFQPVQEECINRHKLCAFWVVNGECESNPTYMKDNCAPSCRLCHRLTEQSRP